MAMYVAIVKEYEDDEKVLYGCGPSKNELMAKFEIIKSNGEIIEIESEPKISRIYFLKAVSKVLKHNEENPSKNYPDKLFYAS